MKRLAILAAVAGLTLLSACATPTPYQAAVPGEGYRTGYSDMRIEDDRYRISFSGNDLTSRETVENYMLYHAAELTLSSGYDWFEMVHRDTDTKTRVVSTPDDPFWGGMSWRFYRRGWGPWGPGFDDWDTVQYTRYQASAEILMHKGDKPSDNPHAYDAHAVKANLESKIIRPAPPAAK